MNSAFADDHDGRQRAGGRDSTTLFLVIAAFAWGFLVIVGAVTVPVVTVSAPPVTASAPPTSSGASATPTTTSNGEQRFESSRVSVLRHDGAAGVVVAGIPAAISLLVGGLLVMEARGRRRALVSIAAWVLSGALSVTGIAGFVTFLVGIVAVPSGVLLILACARAAPRRPRSVPAISVRS